MLVYRANSYRTVSRRRIERRSLNERAIALALNASNPAHAGM